MARILITGSNSGFGLLTVLSLARSGHHVVATMRNLDKGAELERRLADEGLTAEIRRLDVCDPSSVDEAVGDPAALDVLINNAGFEVQAAVSLLDDDLLRRQLDTNVLGPVRLMRAVLPTWARRGSGTIVNVSSVAGIVGVPYGGAYAASKHALEAVSEAVHFENSQVGVRVRLVEPGRFETGFSDNIVTPPGWEETPDYERATSLREATRALTGDGPEPDPQLVANAIVAAAVDPEAPFRQFVGTDAELVRAAKTSMTFEEFDVAMRATMDWYD